MSALDPVAVRVTKQIRAAIISGVLAPGERLREHPLSARYGVSRIPIREALRSLESEGLVETRPFAGASVAASPEDDATDLFDVRAVVEAATARRAAERAQRQALSATADPRWAAAHTAIHEVLDQGDACLAAGDVAALAPLNMRFHELVAELGGSGSLCAMLHQISGRIEWLFAAHVTQRGPSAWSEHRVIMERIDAGDADAAAQLMREHVERSREGYLRLTGAK